MPQNQEPQPPPRSVSWDELADIYDSKHPGSRPARTLPMELVADWAERRTDLFDFDDEGYILRKAAKEEART